MEIIKCFSPPLPLPAPRSVLPGIDVSEFFECFDFVCSAVLSYRGEESAKPANEIFVTNRSFLRNLINELPEPIVKDVAAMRYRLV